MSANTLSPYLTCTFWQVAMHNRLEHHVALDGFANIHLQFLQCMRSIFKLNSIL